MEGLEDDRVSWPVVATRDLHRDDWVVALREDRVARLVRFATTLQRVTAR